MDGIRMQGMVVFETHKPIQAKERIKGPYSKSYSSLTIPLILTPKSLEAVFPERNYFPRSWAK
ncbi:hypothetical protein Hsar01_00860 [Haloferula sargassicola]|uniref:Uncharacterized protein n=1 Tax=Haloferula sargassicola TaxID=490096 RepID=A0ABP9UNP6_9BACT